MSFLARSLALAALGLAAAPAEAQEFRTYVNPRFGTTAEVPAGWRAGPEPANGDGRVFTAPDGQASVTVSGSLHVADTVEEAMALREEPDDGDTVTYRQRGRRSVVVSGVRGDHIFYRKSVLGCRDQVWNSVALQYPAARKAVFDPVVRRVAGSLRQGRGFQVQGC